MIGGLQMFDVPQILTNGKGGPDRTSTTMIMYLNNHLFSKNYGMAGAVSVVEVRSGPPLPLVKICGTSNICRPPIMEVIMT